MFLDRFRSDKWKIEFIAIWQTGATVIPEEYALKTKSSNVYFLANVRKDLVYNWFNRAKDIDIIEKNYLVIDIDYRKQAQETLWYNPTDDEIINFWKDIEKYLLEEHTYLWDYDFIVFSWNWLHIYYLWEPKAIEPNDYAYAMERIMREWDKYWWNPVYNADKACKNIARIIRLPWSINQKTWKECFVISERQGSWLLFNSIQVLAEAEKEEVLKKREEENQRKIEEYQKQEKMNRLINWDKYEENQEKLHKLFKKIDSIPAYLVAQKINPMFPLSKNWKNFDNEKWWYTWYYYLKDMNAIVNWWSQHFLFNWTINSCWTPSNLVKHQYDFTWKETIDWFKKNFDLKF